MSMTFEQAEALLTPERRSELALCLLEDRLPSAKLSLIERTFYEGLAIYREYEDEDAVRNYLC